MKTQTRKLLKKAIFATTMGFVARSALKQLTAYNLKDKIVLITGGSRGLGLVLAREFGKRHARLAICARDAEELKRAQTDLASRSVEILPVVCDITKRSSVDEMMATVQDHYGRVDVLVNNAGVIEAGPLEEMTLDDFRSAMDTHFWGPLYTTLAVLPQMRRRRAGRIVNISSIGGKISVPHLVPYCASKFALVGLSEGLRAELLKDGIRVTTVCPGLMRTGSARNAEFKGQHRAEYALFSLGAALPITSIGAERAAKQIVAACRRGEAEVILSIQAQVAALAHGIFPAAVTDMMGLINVLLPGPGGIGDRKTKGKNSTSAVSPSILTALNDRAAVRNNEMG